MFFSYLCCVEFNHCALHQGMTIIIFIWLADGSVISWTPELIVFVKFLNILNCLSSYIASVFSFSPPHLFYFSFIFISGRLITLQYCSGFCHTLTWSSHGFTRVPHPEPSSHIPPHPIPLGHHASNQDWRSVSHLIKTCFDVILLDHPTLAFSHRIQKSVPYIYVSFSVLQIELSYIFKIPGIKLDVCYTFSPKPI